MKLKAGLIGSVLVLMSVMLAACGGADDGKITTTKAPSTSAVTTRANTTQGGIMDEMSSAAGDVSEGLSDAASEIRSDIRGLLD